MKKMIIVKSVLMLCLLGVSAMPALAAEQDQKMNYARANLGIYNPTDDLDDNNYDNGGNLSILYGRYLTPYLSVEAGLDFFASENDFSGSNTIAGTFTRENVMSGHGLNFTLKGEYPAGPVRLYAGGGFGLYAATLITEVKSSSLGDFDKCKSDFMTSAHVIAGLDFDINDRWFINIEGKYRVTDDVDINETVASVPVVYSGNMTGYSVTAGFGFRF
ncbi:MAG: porin family protein [Deltaproteobacteria bacterium]|nr:porin family protein [Deltaproteobacteria bacterium]